MAHLYGLRVINSEALLTIFDKISRRAAQRICCAYRTVSRISATIIAGIIPPEYVALRLTYIYEEIAQRKEWGIKLTHGEELSLYSQARVQAFTYWKKYLDSLNDEDPGVRVRKAFLPVLKEWIERRHGTVIWHVLYGSNSYRSWLFQCFFA